MEWWKGIGKQLLHPQHSIDRLRGACWFGWHPGSSYVPEIPGPEYRVGQVDRCIYQGGEDGG
jgi:hypothetical protein